MRDFRDAKAMAQTLRDTLAAHGHPVTVGQSLELIAQAFGARDWNTLAAQIKDGTALAPPTLKTDDTPPNLRQPTVRLSELTDVTLGRVVDYATGRGHWGQLSYEHVMLALLDDPDAAKMLRECEVDLDGVRRDLTLHLDHLPRRAIDDPKVRENSWNFGFVTLPALGTAAMRGRSWATGADMVSAMFQAKDSRVPAILRAHGYNERRAWNLVMFGAPDAGIKRSDELNAIWKRAARNARATHRFVTTEDILPALLDDPHASAMLSAYEVDRETVRRDIHTALASLPAGTNVPDSPERKLRLERPERPELGRRVDHAITLAAALGYTEVTGAHLLENILTSKDTPAAAILGTHGLNHSEAVEYVQQNAPKRGNVT
jgi:ATP-dependent Clp protease ATP-binding subunit ClpA